MKTYSGKSETSGGENAVSLRRKRIVWSAVAVVSVIAIILTVVLSVTLSRRGPVDVPVDAPPVVDEPPLGDVDAGTKPQLFRLPVENAKVSAECSLTALVYSPSVNMWKTHNGVDFEAAEGATVSAIADGMVIGREETTLEGVVVSVRHADGVVSVYKSLGSASVEVGAEVKAGDALGTVGKDLIESSEGAHLHLEMAVNGELVDPLAYLSVVADK